MRKWIDFVGGLVFPPRCPICDEVVALWDDGVCLSCIRKIKYVDKPRCLKCGKHITDTEKEYCEDCSQNTHVFTQGRALYEYKEVAKAIYRFKYGGRQEYAGVFGEEMAYYLGDYVRSLKPDGLVPVPMHPRKQRSRGYNQAVLLARSLGERLGIPVYENLVKRIRNTKPLKYLNPEERLNNLKKAFILTENGVKLNTIIIIDDIYTTGSTVDTLAGLFLEQGVQSVYFLTLTIGETV